MSANPNSTDTTPSSQAAGPSSPASSKKKIAVAAGVAAVVVALGVGGYFYSAGDSQETTTCKAAVSQAQKTVASLDTQIASAREVADAAADESSISDEQRQGVEQAITQAENLKKTALPSCQGNDSALTKASDEAARLERQATQASQALETSAGALEITMLYAAKDALDTAITQAESAVSSGQAGADVQEALDSAKKVDRSDRKAVVEATTALEEALGVK